MESLKIRERNNSEKKYLNWKCISLDYVKTEYQNTSDIESRASTWLRYVPLKVEST